ncbi:MAG: transporter [Deltaproteobacteria bacterium]|nr:transporter [Deltaproteobacteria bacterium]
MNRNRMAVARLWLTVAAILTFAALCPQQALAQVPARFYLKPLAGVSAIPLIFESISGNTNPFDPSHRVTLGADFAEVDATMALAGYALTFPLFERSAMAAVLVPMGRISGEASKGGTTLFKESASGFGDPMLEFTLNLIGPPAQMNIPDALAYEPGFSLDLLVDLMLPIGEYDNDQQINIGQNRWYGRLGMPIIWQLGPWVPGRRTTLELLPVVWLFGDNDDFVGQTMETDPLFQVDAHLTRDFTQTAWGSLDLSWYYGGKATIAGIEGDKRNDIMAGITLGYQVNDNLNLTFGYKSTLNDDGPDDVRQDLFMVTLTYGWHPMVEGMRRLKSE